MNGSFVLGSHPIHEGHRRCWGPVQGSCDKEWLLGRVGQSDEERAFSSTERKGVRVNEGPSTGDAGINGNDGEYKRFLGLRSSYLSGFLWCQAYPEDGAAARPFVDADGPAMNLDGALDDR